MLRQYFTAENSNLPPKIEVLEDKEHVCYVELNTCERIFYFTSCGFTETNVLKGNYHIGL